VTTGEGGKDPHFSRLCRRPLAVPAVSLVVSLVALVLLAVWATRGPGPAEGIDLDVHRWLLRHRSPALVGVAAVVTRFGSAIVVVPLVFLGVLAVSPGDARRRLARAAATLSFLAAGLLLRLAVSQLVARARPPAKDWAAAAAGYAFPSGHTTGAALAAALLAWTITQRLQDQPLARSLVWAVAACAGLAVGLTRVYLGMHWPSDVLGSWLLCAAVLSGGLLLLRLRRTADVATGGRLGRHD